VRCPRCGNENPVDNRFCGMCGATLLAAAPDPAKPQPVPTPAAPTPIRAEAVPARSAELPREPMPAPIPRDDEPDSPSISGPSFLGLGDPAPRRSSQRTRDSLSIDPNHSRGSGSLDYLLEDDEERPSGAWKYILILVALALAIGFGYLRFKDQGLAWLNTALKKPAAATSEPDTTASGAPAPSPTAPAPTPSTSPDSQPPAATTQPAAGSTQPPASATATSPGASGNPPSTAQASGNVAPPASPDGDTTKSSDSPNGTTNSDKGAAAAAAKDSTATSDDRANADGASAQPSAKPAAKAPTPKPHPTVPAVDPVTEAQKYLYGRGAAQDCDRGLRLLKPAANQANPKAMIEMGALYSAGLCTPRDLPTAYRWFAMALRKDPDNTNVQADLQKLWSEMTQPERQLAIKLSQ
jgi:zinc-ribbon domain/Sel1 repeat